MSTLCCYRLLAGAQVHGITTDVGRRIQQHVGIPDRSSELPPILVLNSAVDATVTADAVVNSRLMADENLPFAVTIVGNKELDGPDVVARYKPSRAKEVAAVTPLEMSWPAGVISLSHVAMPFPPDDPLYGQSNPGDGDSVFLGNLAIKGERGLLKLPADWLLRLRHNPFYDYLETRVIDWLDKNGGRDQASFR